jgi:hypothetical protein
MTTPSRPSASSLGAKVRPSAARTPKTSKYDAETRDASSWIGSLPIDSVAGVVEYAAMFSNTRCCCRQSTKFSAET